MIVFSFSFLSEVPTTEECTAQNDQPSPGRAHKVLIRGVSSYSTSTILCTRLIVFTAGINCPCLWFSFNLDWGESSFGVIVYSTYLCMCTLNVVYSMTLLLWSLPVPMPISAYIPVLIIHSLRSIFLKLWCICKILSTDAHG